MAIDWIPFEIPINTVLIASSCLWSLGLYLAFVSLKFWLIEQFQRWLNFADRSLYTSQEAFEQTRDTREAQNLFYASVVSILPFLVAGALCTWAIAWGLGSGWPISTGILATIIGGIYALGRQDSEA